MELIVRDSYETMSAMAAQLIATCIEAKPQSAVVVAVGNTPTRCYSELSQLHKQGVFDVQQLRPFQLDEYLLAPDDPRSLYRWVKRDFLDPLGIPAEQLVRLRGVYPMLRSPVRSTMILYGRSGASISLSWDWGQTVISASMNLRRTLLQQRICSI